MNVAFADLSAEVQRTFEEEREASKMYHLHGYLNGSKKKHSFLVDTGAQMCILPLAVCEKEGWAIQPSEVQIRAVNGNIVAVDGQIQLMLKIGNVEKLVWFLVTKRCNQSILGVNALRGMGFTLKLDEGKLHDNEGNFVQCHVISISKN